MHFLVFEDGCPMEVHQFNKPTVQKYYIWQPPKREKPYLFKAGKYSEPIYGFMFTLTENDHSDITNYNRFSDRIPKRLKPTLKLLELIFGRESDDYAKDLQEIYGLLIQDLILVTSRGIRMQRVLTYSDIAVESNTILATNLTIVTLFMNMVRYNVVHHKQTRQEAFDTALETHIFGEFYHAQIPSWWLNAKQHYGSDS